MVRKCNSGEFGVTERDALSNLTDTIRQASSDRPDPPDPSR
jgi:hypothetical protein